MSKFGDDLIQALNEALAHAKGDGAAIVQSPIAREEGFVRDQLPGEGEKGEQIKTNDLFLGRNLPRHGRREGRLE